MNKECGGTTTRGSIQISMAVFNWGPIFETEQTDNETTGCSLIGYGTVWDCEEDERSGIQGTDGSNKPDRP